LGNKSNPDSIDFERNEYRQSARKRERSLCYSIKVGRGDWGGRERRRKRRTEQKMKPPCGETNLRKKHE